MIAQFFWLTLFSLTAKAALSISFDEEETDVNPAFCKILCLVSLIYCFMLDQSLFGFHLSPIQLGLCMGLACLVFTMLLLHAQSPS